MNVASSTRLPRAKLASRARALAALLFAAIATHGAWAAEKKNFFDDPFVRVTAGVADCPIPEGPLITEEQMHAEAHVRTERGTRCFQAGQCRLPNAYLYDKEIIARVKKAVEYDGRFADTSVWALGQRRWVVLQGCVRRKSDAEALEHLVRGIDDVERVVNQLVVRSSSERAKR
jgi:hypothetical protein